MLVIIAKADRTTAGRSRVTPRWFHCFSRLRPPARSIFRCNRWARLHDNVFVGGSIRCLVRITQSSSVRESRSETRRTISVIGSNFASILRRCGDELHRRRTEYFATANFPGRVKIEICSFLDAFCPLKFCHPLCRFFLCDGRQQADSIRRRVSQPLKTPRPSPSPHLWPRLEILLLLLHPRLHRPLHRPRK